MTSELPPDIDEPKPPPPEPHASAESPTIEVRREPWLRRSGSDRYLSGLAGGVGQRLRFDPLLLRVGLVGATTFLAYAGGQLHPFVLVPYFLAWADRW